MSQSTPSGTQRIRATARGTTKAVIAQMVAAGCGLAIHVYLARALLPELYGVLAVVTSVISWWEWSGIALLAGATTHFVARAADNWKQVAGTAAQTALISSLLLAAGSILAAPVIAGALGDPRLTGYIWLFTIDLAAYPLFHVFAQVSRGRRRYGRWAGALMIYWVAKAGLMCGLVALGLSVKGAIMGSIGASAVGLIFAWWWSGVGLPRAGFPVRTLLLFGLPMMGSMVVGRLMENMDLWCVKALLKSVQAPGYYGAAKYMYQAVTMLPMAVGAAMVPTLTQAISTDNKESRRELIEQSFRFVLVTMLAALAIVGSCAQEVVVLIFSAPYAAAAVPALVLMAAALMFSLRGISSAMIVAAGKPGLCLAVVAPLLPVNIALNLVLVPRYELVGGALATAITGLLAAAVMLILVWREFHVLFSAVSLLRCTVAAAVVYFLGLIIPGVGWLVVVKLAGLLGVYLLLLIASGELTRRDFEPLLFWRG